jgi:ABC-type phosphate transport system substrate-binding protein
MKTIKLFKSILVTLLISSPIFAQNNVNETIYIKSSRFASPLIQKWINEYTKVNPQAQLRLADNSVKAENIALKVVVSDNSKNGLQIGEQILVFGRYAILPVIGKDNPLLAEFSKKKLNDKRIKELFFEKDILSEDTNSSKSDYDVTVYSGNNNESVAHSFASYFGYTSSSLKGKKISGDDAFLINAIQKDKTGVTFNALGNIFDINTRGLKDNITILPLDVKKEYRNYFTESVNIDNVIELLESEPVDLIPVDNIGFAYSPGNKAVKEFLVWVLTEGKTFNHSYGILNPDEKVLTYQIKELEKVLYTMNLK